VRQRDWSFVGLIIAAASAGFVGICWLVGRGSYMGDFDGPVLRPAARIAAGANPYLDPSALAYVFTPPVYPPPLMLGAVPLTYVSYDVATWIWLGFLVACLLGSLYIVGLRDLRTYFAACVGAPVLFGLGCGNTVFLLMLSVALLWRFRDNAPCGALGFALGLIVKPLLWPLFFWLLLTRRFALALYGATLSVSACLLGWAVIGWDGFSAYPELIKVLGHSSSDHGWLVISLLRNLGMHPVASESVGCLVGLGIMSIALLRRNDLERFSLALAAALVMSPVMWGHYFALLLVPLAIARPRFGALWLLPVALWPFIMDYDTDFSRPLSSIAAGMVYFVITVLAIVTSASPWSLRSVGDRPVHRSERWLRTITATSSSR